MLFFYKSNLLIHRIAKRKAMKKLNLYPQICFIIWFHFFDNAGVNTISSAGISVRAKKFKSS